MRKIRNVYWLKNLKEKIFGNLEIRRVYNIKVDNKGTVSEMHSSDCQVH
jgi:hypothetical protein